MSLIIHDYEGLKNPNLTPADRRRLGKKGAGRWVYCKYCYKNVLPVIDEPEGLVVCSVCGYGLAPLDEVRKAGSYDKWYQGICLDFARLNKYLDDMKNGMEPTGKDEFGIVPYICEDCKKEYATCYSKRGHLCNECDYKIRKENGELSPGEIRQLKGIKEKPPILRVLTAEEIEFSRKVSESEEYNKLCKKIKDKK